MSKVENFQQQEENSFLIFHVLSFKQHIVAILFFSLALLVDKFRAFSHLSTHFYGGSSRDAGLYYWLVLQSKELFSRPWFDTQAFYPYSGTLAWSDNFILPGVFHSFLSLCGFPSITAYNLVLFSALLLNAYFTFKLCFHLSGAYFASLISGLGFLFYAYFSQNAGHPQLLFAFWIPLSVIFLFRYINTLRFPYALASCLCIAGSFLCSVYYAIFLVILLPLLLIGLQLLKPHFFSIRQWLDFFIGGFLTACLLLPFILPYLETRSLFGQRFIYESIFFAANGASYFSSSSINWLYGSLLSGLSHDEARLFPGFVLFVILLLALLRLYDAKKIRKLSISIAATFILLFLTSWFAKGSSFFLYAASILAWALIPLSALFLKELGSLEREKEYYLVSNRNLLSLFLFCALVFFILSLGPLGNPALGQFTTAPYALLYHIMPGFSAIRASGRLGIVSIWFLFLLVPFILPRFKSRGNKFAISAYSFAALFFVLENVAVTFPLEEPEKVPEAYAISAHHLMKKNAVLAIPTSPSGSPKELNLNVTAYAKQNVDSMLFASPGRYQLVNGYSGQMSKLHDQLAFELKNFPDKVSIARISTISNLSHLIYHGNLVKNFDAERFVKNLSFYPEIDLQKKDDNNIFLLGFNPETRITPDFRLLLPARSGKINLELKALFETDSPDVLLDVFIENYQDKIPLKTITLKADDIFNDYSIDIPSDYGSLKPLKLYFNSTATGRIYLKKRIFTPDAN